MAAYMAAFFMVVFLPEPEIGYQLLTKYSLRSAYYFKSDTNHIFLLLIIIRMSWGYWYF